MKDKNQSVSVQVDKNVEKIRKEEVDELYKKLEQTEKMLIDPNGIGVISIMKKQTLVVTMAELYERLYDLNESKVPTNEIANFLVKRFAELKLEIHHSTVYDNLPARFKTHVKNPISEENHNHSENPNESSSLNTVPPFAENASWIKILELQIDFLKSFKNKLSTTQFLSLLPSDEKAKVRETFSNIYTVIQIANAIFDDRQSVPIELQHLLVSAFITQTNNDAAGLYITKVKDFGANRSKEARKKLSELAKIGKEIKNPDTLTSKQAVKIMLGHVTKVSQIYEPMNRDEALFCGYHGTQCPNPECKSWRTYLDFDANELQCRCYACDTGFERGVTSKCKSCYLPFYDEIIIEMKKKAKNIIDGIIESKCPKCKNETFLPIKKIMTILVKSK